MPAPQTPPQWIVKLLQSICDPYLLEGILGDLEEKFEQQVQSHGLSKARKRFVWQALGFLRPFTWKKFSFPPFLTPITMFFHHFKIAWRQAKRRKTFSLINALGLALGMVSALLIFRYTAHERSYEKIYPLADRIARITVDVFDQGELVLRDACSYRSTGPILHSSLPEVEAFTRVYRNGTLEMRREDRRFKERRGYMAEANFFAFFPNAFIEGQAQDALAEPYSLVLTESTARKYLGNTPALGKTLQLQTEQHSIPMKITGVVSDLPGPTHLNYDFLISYATGFALFQWQQENWSSNEDYTYVLLQSANSFPPFEEKLSRVTDTLVTQRRLRDEAFAAERLTDIHLYSDKTYEPEPTGDINTINLLELLALFILLLATVNYVNLATARSMERAREVGIRKILGSHKGLLIRQFFVEAFLFNLIACIIALSVIVLSLPWFYQFLGISSAFPALASSAFWQQIALIVLGSTFLSGFYPALALSSFHPSTVLRGSFRASTKGNTLRKSLVVFQFALSVILIAGALTVGEQLRFLQQKDLGMKIDQTLVIQAPASAERMGKFLPIQEALKQNAQITSVAGSECIPGLAQNELSTTNGVFLNGMAEQHNYTFYNYGIDENFLGLYDMQLVAGRNFLPSDNGKNVLLLNEEVLRLWNITQTDSILGKRIDMWGAQWTLIGVVRNFHQVSPKSPHIPLLLFYRPDAWQYASLRIQPQNLPKTLSEVRKLWAEYFPQAPFSYFFLDKTFQQQYKSDERFKYVFGLLTGLALLIAAMGLFGLAAYNTLQRTKEVGIRKVLGASVASITGLLSTDLLKLVLLSIVIATPLTYLFLKDWLSQFPYRIEIFWWLLALPAVLVLIIAMLSVITQTLKAALTDPVLALRQE